MLDGLVERVKVDPGAPFEPAVLAHLAALKSEDPAKFEGLRAQLKKAGCRITELDRVMAREQGPAGDGRPKQADILIELAASAELFHDPSGIAFADIIVDSHRETWPIRGGGFRHWLARRYYLKTRGAPNSEALQSALNVIEARARFDGPERPVSLRVSGLDGKLYLDLADDEWQAIEIDADGWRVCKNPPVRFRRTSGMLASSAPKPGGSIEALRPFLNLANNEDFVLVVAWLLAALRHRGPYPLLAVAGEQGSAKSTFSKMLRSLIDPSTAPLRALPREDRELFIAANNAHVLIYDNVSNLPPWISDTLCRLATGGGFAVRALYTDTDEVIFDAARPMMLNGIEEIITRPDLADRAVFLILEAIPPGGRRLERDLWVAFDAERPRILGALLDAAAHGLRMLSETRLSELPRMADFALWIAACEGALWPTGTFEAAYRNNRESAIGSVIEADPVACGVRALMDGRTVWTGTATHLLAHLKQRVADQGPGFDDGLASPPLPDNPRALSGRLRRAASFLRQAGIAIDFERVGQHRTRTITITNISPQNP